jgi:hypothetical protein
MNPRSPTRKASSDPKLLLNNNYQDQGQRNARTLIGLLGDSAVTAV